MLDAKQRLLRVSGDVREPFPEVVYFVMSRMFEKGIIFIGCP